MSTSSRRGLFVAAAVYLALFAALSTALLLKHEPREGSDYWMHLAAIRTLAQGGSPADLPLDGDPNIRQRHYDPFHVAWAGVLRLSGLPGSDVMALAAIVNVAVFLCAVAFLASCFGRTAAAAVCLLVTMLFVCGFGYGWSNEYYLSILPEVGPFPSTLAWGLSLFAFGLIHTWSRRGGAARLAGATVLGTSVTAIHPLTALMFTLSFPVLWVWLGRNSRARRWTVLIYPGTALALSLVWRHSSVLDQIRAVLARGAVHLGGSEAGTWFLSPGQVLLALGPALAGVLFLAWVPRRLRRPLAAGMVLYALAWIGGSLVGVPLAHRFVFFLVFVLHLTIALAMLSGWRLWLHRRRLRPGAPLAAPVPAALAASVMLLIPWAPLHALRLANEVRGRLDLKTLSLLPSPLEQFEAACVQLKGELPPGAKVLTDRLTARQLAAFGLPIVPTDGLTARPPETIGAGFAALVTKRQRLSGATHMLLRHAELNPAETGVLAGLGAVRQMPPDVIVVTLKAPGP